MKNKKIVYSFIISIIILVFSACKSLRVTQKTEKRDVPISYKNNLKDTTNISKIAWKDYFTDSNLTTLIDTALSNNQELNITLQEIEIARNRISKRKGAYLPFFDISVGGGAFKHSRYTPEGASEEITEIAPGISTPKVIPNLMLSLNSRWEIDVWKKLRNAKKIAVKRFLGSIAGKNFMITNIIAEIANTYYELLAMDKQLDILNENIKIQGNALETVRLQMISGRATALSVRRFEAAVLNTKSLKYKILQGIIESENYINFLAGRFPQPIKRDNTSFEKLNQEIVKTGIPSQLLLNRPDIIQAEQELIASKLDIKVARAKFYPAVNIYAGLGLQSFNTRYFISPPQSLLYSLLADLSAPLLNRKAIKAELFNANARQIQAAYRYEKTILNAFVEVTNQVAKIKNLENSYDLKNKEVKALIEAVSVSENLFKSARATYMEVLITQKDAIQSRFELVETRKKQFISRINIYRALGGGW